MQGRALIVDDEVEMCDLMQEVLKSTGMNSLALTHSAEAAHHLQQERFEVVLLDFRMRPPDGIELTRQIRQSGFNQMTPVILVSEDRQITTVSLGFQAGASFVLYKPIDKARLLKLIWATQGAIDREKRRFRRVAHRANVLLGSGGRKLEGETIDLSLNGMLVKAEPAFPVGSIVNFRLSLTPEARPICGTGTVVRLVGPDQMGIHLEQLSPMETARLQSFLLPLLVPETPAAEQKVR
jgi:CheY-like chemotaxis protein